MADHDDHAKFIKKKLKEGASASQVVSSLVEGGWQHDVAQKAVNDANEQVPPPPDGVPAPPNTTSQTGNAGQPLQVENVQYNMGVKTVESRVGTFLKISSVGLWFTVIFVSWLAASLIGLIGDSDGDFATQLVFTISLSAVSVPVFILADKKMREELVKNHALVDDLFYKKNVRGGLNTAIGLSAISIFLTLFLFLSAAFLSDSDSSFTGAFQALMFSAGFGGALYYYWKLHAKTKR